MCLIYRLEQIGQRYPSVVAESIFQTVKKDTFISRITNQQYTYIHMDIIHLWYINTYLDKGNIFELNAVFEWCLHRDWRQNTVCVSWCIPRPNGHARRTFFLPSCGRSARSAALAMRYDDTLWVATPYHVHGPSDVLNSFSLSLKQV